MEIAFFLKKFITELIIPPFNLLLLIAAGLLLRKRLPRVATALAWTSTVILLALSTPAISRLLLRAVNIERTYTPASAAAAQAIIVLGGGLRRNTPEYGDTPNAYTLDRIRYGATVARDTHLPLLVTGGAVAAETPEAEAMARVLKEEFSTPVRWIESKAMDTGDNLQFSATVLKPEGIETVILVTHDFHMRRALALCALAKLHCIPAPVSIASNEGDTSWVFQLPNAQSLAISGLAIHEIIGNLALSFQ